jgi:hypothetical protein
MGPKTENLICLLDQLAAVLESDGEAHWSHWARNARTRLLNSDYSGIDYVLSAYGGMGSLNELVLGQNHEHGVFTWKPGHIKLNERFDKLRSDAAQFTDAISRS